MDFVFTLHSHLPYVLNHGRWPHGSDWICEAAADTYLPLLETFLRLEAEDTPAAFAEAAFRALDAYADTTRWRALVRRGMARDFSWERSVATYLDVYRRALVRAR